MAKTDALTLARSILVNSIPNDTNAIGLLIFILRRLKKQLRLYRLMKYSLRYDNNKTGVLIRVFKYF